MIKKLISTTLIFSFLFSILSISTFATDNLSKKIEEPDYDPTSILVVINKDYSKLNKSYKVEAFDKGLISSVTDLMPVSAEKSRKEKIYNDEQINPDAGRQILKLGLSDKGQKNIESVLKTISEYPMVESAEKNYYLELYSIPSSVTPNDTSFSSQHTYINRIMANKAWAITKGKSSVLVGVADSGIGTGTASPHTDLANKVDTSLSQNYTNSSTLADTHGHGTHVAGIIAATTNNGTGAASIGWNVKLINLKTYSTNFDTAALAAAIESATKKNIKLLNCSSGTLLPTNALKNAVANYSGLLIAGSGKTSSVMAYPAGYASTYNHVISVTATYSNDDFYIGSSYSKTQTNLAAPGVSIYSLWLNNGYERLSGTSMSAAMVTATAALIWSINSNFSRTQVRNYILNNVDVVSDLSTRCSTSGRLNVFKAVMAAAGYKMGDIDFDGDVDTYDAREALQAATNIIIFTERQLAVSDVDYDGDLDTFDARTILQMAVDII